MPARNGYWLSARTAREWRLPWRLKLLHQEICKAGEAVARQMKRTLWWHVIDLLRVPEYDLGSRVDCLDGKFICGVDEKMDRAKTADRK